MKSNSIDIFDPSPVLLLEWFGITQSNCRRTIIGTGKRSVPARGCADRGQVPWPDAAFDGLDWPSPLDNPFERGKIHCLRLHRFVPAKRKIEKLRMDVVQATQNIVHTAMPFTTFLAKLLAAKVLRNAGENEAADKVWS